MGLAFCAFDVACNTDSINKFRFALRLVIALLRRCRPGSLRFGFALDTCHLFSVSLFLSPCLSLFLVSVPRSLSPCLSLFLVSVSVPDNLLELVVFVSVSVPCLRSLSPCLVPVSVPCLRVLSPFKVIVCLCPRQFAGLTGSHSFSNDFAS